jgi:tRNA(fMet)-specific endonuclease VapC
MATPSGSKETCAMSGERYLLDTNAVVALLRGDQALQQRLQNAEWVGISILSQIEFLAFPNITQQDRQAFQRFSERVDVVGLDRAEPALIDRIVDLRQQYRVKLPDAIIAATAVERNATLITDDGQLREVAAVRSIGIS